VINWTQIVGFNWDEGNARKSTEKHDVSQAESEQIFFNQPLLLLHDFKHSQNEERFHALGKTDDRRQLHITFTQRTGDKGMLIRVISARDMNMSKLKKIPDFKSDSEERRFWEENDSSEYLDWSKAKRASFPNLKPSTKTISLRLPEGLLDRIKIEANKRDMPYQSLIKVWLSQNVDTHHQH